MHFMDCCSFQFQSTTTNGSSQCILFTFARVGFTDGRTTRVQWTALQFCSLTPCNSWEACSGFLCSCNATLFKNCVKVEERTPWLAS